MNKQLLNTLYVQTQGAYLHLDHETVVLEVEDEDPAQIPLHHLGGIAVFGNVLVSPHLLHKCSEDGRSVVWFSWGGRFRGRLQGPVTGNVLLRRGQHEALSDDKRTLSLAQAFVGGKIRNTRYVLQRGLRDGLPDPDPVETGIERLDELREDVKEVASLDALRGVEGNASKLYFGLFDDLIRSEEEGFIFTGRNRRPPRDRVNALLSFAYSILTNECASALEGVGLDPQTGYLHALRPGRPALALDLVEEFRSVIADRAVLTLINRDQLAPDDFEERPGGAVLLTDDGRSTFLQHWQERKQREVHHPVLERSVPYGLLPHVQARLLARTLREDIDTYPAFTPK